MRAAQVRRHHDGPRLTDRLGTQGDAFADTLVDVIVDEDPHGASGPAEARRDHPGSASRVRVAAAGLLLAGLVALLLWPQASTPGQPAGPSGRTGPSDAASLATWPARGELADDARLALAGERAWRASAGDGAQAQPGPDVDVLFAGRVDDQTVMLLRSWSLDGRLVVAAGLVRSPAEVEILQAAPVDWAVPWLTLPPGERLRVLVDPQVAADSALALRRDEGIWGRVSVTDEGVSMPLRSLDRPDPLVGVVTADPEGRGLTSVHSVDRLTLLPRRSPVQVVPAQWGERRLPSMAEYDAGLFAVPALPESSGAVAVLAAAPLPGGGWAALTEYRSSTDGRLRTAMVVPDAASARPVLGFPVVRSDVLAAGHVARPGGRTLVLAAASPEIARVEVTDPDGATLVDGRGPANVVLPAPAPDEVAVVGKRADDDVVTSLRLPLRAASAGPV